MATLVGQTIGKYKVAEHLGKGGMAEVYKAYQENLDRYVAIKVMHSFLASETDFLQRFKREARAMAAVNHPNIVGVFDFDVFGGDNYYLVMEYVSGGTLKEELTRLAQQGQRLPLERTVQIMQEITSALAYAHGRGMIHRDIKPANIMLDEDGKAILTDFGIVKLIGGDSMAYTATGALIGTPAYMAPEQALGKPGDERCDIYSLGVLLFQMTTGKLPFDADTPLAVVMKHVNDPTPLPVSFNPDVPLRLQEVILKAMSKEPDNRFQTAKEMGLALLAVDLTAVDDYATVNSTASTVDTAITDVAHTVMGSTQTAVSSVGETVPPPTATVPPADKPKKKRSPWLWVGLLLLAIILVSGALVGLNAIGANDAEPTVVVAIVAENNDTSTPMPPTNTAEPAIETPSGPDTEATLAALVSAEETRAAQPTETPLPTETSTPEPTPTHTVTPDATATFIASCTIDVELIEAHPYRTNTFNTAPIGTTFPMYWTLRNSGTCPWPNDLRWTYVEGSVLGYDGEPVPLEVTIAENEEVELTTTFIAPTQVNTYESTWQLIDADGATYGPALTFEIRTFVPATSTPTAEPATETPEATVEVTELNYAFAIGPCRYLDANWQCDVEITPYGGGGGPYTVLVFDQPAGQATENRGPFPFRYFALARRCAAFNSNIRIIDDATGSSFDRHLYIDPDDYIEGGCTES